MRTAAPSGWNHGRGVQSTSLHLVCYGWPSDTRRLTEADLRSDEEQKPTSARPASGGAAVAGALLCAIALGGCAPAPRMTLICNQGIYVADEGAHVPVLVCRQPDARGYVQELE